MRIPSMPVALLIVALAAACTPGTAPTTTSSPTVTQVSSTAPSSTSESSPTAESSAPVTSEPTTTAGTTFVVSEPGEFGPGVTAVTPASGWTLEADLAGLFKGDEVGNVPEAAIVLWPHPAGTEFYVPADPCQSGSTMPDTPATTPDEISLSLAAQALRGASDPVDVTIGGYPGKSLTVHVPDDVVFADCEGETFLTYATGDDPGARIQQGPGQVDEIWILDVNGSIVIISAMSRPDTSTELVEEMRSIAQSATFQLAG
jgi:hypothetical protein